MGMTEPIVIEENKGLGMTMPSASITVSDIARMVGEDKPIEVIDVATQSEQTGWTMGRWASYYDNPHRDRIRNVISLEISDTDLSKKITRPEVVRQLDWIDHMWPSDLKPKEYPKVQLYCLMGTKDSYTDFHIDFGGSSVFYHIIKGSKMFYFIRPTQKNLKKYRKWSSSPDQSTTFFGDEVKECYEVKLAAGNTMIIPAGWIHAVYTPEDAIVIGGNFLHGLDIPTQLCVHSIEEATDVPWKFRFPHFKRINWYAAARYNDMLNDLDHHNLSERELLGIAVLVRWLMEDIIKLEEKSNASEEERELIRLEIPSTEIPDPGQLTDELHQRVIKALSNVPCLDPKLMKSVKHPKTDVNKNESRQKDRKPKIVLEINSDKKSKFQVQGRTGRDQDYIYEEEELDVDDDIKSMQEGIMDSDDEEYTGALSGDEYRGHTGERPKRQRQVPHKKITEETDSSDDEMGTQSATKTAKKTRVTRKLPPKEKPAGRNPRTTLTQRILKQVKR